jgi:hypothetical protein
MQVMKWFKIFLGEVIFLFASVLIFRSVWTLLDQYLQYKYLIVLLIVGVALTLLGLYIINYEVQCLWKQKHQTGV